VKEIWLKLIMYAGVQMDILFTGNFIHYNVVIYGITVQDMSFDF
jgi:hypothetical protein